MAITIDDKILKYIISCFIYLGSTWAQLPLLTMKQSFEEPKLQMLDEQRISLETKINFYAAATLSILLQRLGFQCPVNCISTSL